MNCGNCNSHLEKDSKFCNKCGADLSKFVPVERSEVAAALESQLPVAVGQVEGIVVVPHTEGVVAVPPVEATFPQKPRTTSWINRYIKSIILSASVLLLLVAAFVTYQNNFFGLLQNKSKTHSIVYLKGNELLFRNLSKTKSFTATNSLFENRDDMKGISFLDYAASLGEVIAKQEDKGKNIFFLDQLNKDGVGTLY